MISVSEVRLTEAGQRRAKIARTLGYHGLGKHLPLRELTVESDTTTKVYFVGPVERAQGPQERLGQYEITVGASPVYTKAGAGTSEAAAGSATRLSSRVPPAAIAPIHNARRPSPLTFSLLVTLTPAGQERVRLAMQRGQKSLLGSLAIRKLCVKQNGHSRNYLVGPVRQGGPDQRLARVQIGMKS